MEKVIRPEVGETGRDLNGRAVFVDGGDIEFFAKVRAPIRVVIIIHRIVIQTVSYIPVWTIRIRDSVSQLGLRPEGMNVRLNSQLGERRDGELEGQVLQAKRGRVGAVSGQEHVHEAIELMTGVENGVERAKVDVFKVAVIQAGKMVVPSGDGRFAPDAV